MMNTVNVIIHVLMIYVEHIVVYILFHFLKLKKLTTHLRLLLFIESNISIKLRYKIVCGADLNFIQK